MCKECLIKLSKEFKDRSEAEPDWSIFFEDMSLLAFSASQMKHGISTTMMTSFLEELLSNPKSFIPFIIALPHKDVIEDMLDSFVDGLELPVGDE